MYIEPKEGFAEQRDDWFDAGKYFSVHAPPDRELNTKKFIFLAVTRTDAQALLVDTHKDNDLRSFMHGRTLSKNYVALKPPPPARVKKSVAKNGPAKGAATKTSVAKGPATKEANVSEQKENELLQQLDKAY